MNKRKAVVAMLAATVALMSRKAVMAKDELTIAGTIGVSQSDWDKPQTLSFNLESFDKFVFFHGKEKVTLSPAEIFAILKE